MAKKTQAELKAIIEERKKAQTFTYKTDIWERATDQEVAAIDAAIINSTTRQRRMWDDSNKIPHSSDFFPIIRGQMVAELGEARTDEILAPSVSL